MSPMSATALRKDIYNAVARVNADHIPMPITNNKGKGAVLVEEDDWDAIEETLYLASIPGMTEILATGSAEPIGECFSEDELERQHVWLVKFTKQAKKDSSKLKAAGLDSKAKALTLMARINSQNTQQNHRYQAESIALEPAAAYDAKRPLSISPRPLLDIIRKRDRELIEVEAERRTIN